MIYLLNMSEKDYIRKKNKWLVPEYMEKNLLDLKYEHRFYLSTRRDHLIHTCYRLPKIKEWVDAHDPGSVIIPFSGCLEAKIFDLETEAKEAYLRETGTTR